GEHRPEVLDGERIVTEERGIQVGHHAHEPLAGRPVGLERRRRRLLVTGAERARTGVGLDGQHPRVERARPEGSVAGDRHPTAGQRVQTQLTHRRITAPTVPPSRRYTVTWRSVASSKGSWRHPPSRRSRVKPARAASTSSASGPRARIAHGRRRTPPAGDSDTSDPVTASLVGSRRNTDSTTSSASTWRTSTPLDAVSSPGTNASTASAPPGARRSWTRV